MQRIDPEKNQRPACSFGQESRRRLVPIYRARRTSFEVVRFDAFRAKGPTIYLAQANVLGDTLTRDELGLKARQFGKRTGLRPLGFCVLPSPRPFAFARQITGPSALNTIVQRHFVLCLLNSHKTPLVFRNVILSPEPIAIFCCFMP